MPAASSWRAAPARTAVGRHTPTSSRGSRPRQRKAARPRTPKWAGGRGGRAREAARLVAEGAEEERVQAERGRLPHGSAGRGSAGAGAEGRPVGLTAPAVVGGVVFAVAAGAYLLLR